MQVSIVVPWDLVITLEQIERKNPDLPPFYWCRLRLDTLRIPLSAWTSLKLHLWYFLFYLSCWLPLYTLSLTLSLLIYLCLLFNIQLIKLTLCRFNAYSMTSSPTRVLYVTDWPWKIWLKLNILISEYISAYDVSSVFNEIVLSDIRQEPKVTSWGSLDLSAPHLNASQCWIS